MVARTPPKQRTIMLVAPPLNPLLLRETVKKVDKCMARLQELHFTVVGGSKVMAGVNLSPRSTRGHLRTSLRCKQESLRIKNAASRKSPVGKLPATAVGEWRRMSLPAMLLGETVGEILQASQFAREIVEAVATKTKKTSIEDPITPMTQQRKQRPNPENTELKSKRKKEKQNKLQSIQSESSSPTLRRAISRINFKVSPPKRRDEDKENARYLANRVSPRNKPWAKKTVLFPNPLFNSADSTQQQKFYRTRSPVITKNRQTTPHKFLIKSPPSASKFQVKINSSSVLSVSPARAANLSKKSPSATRATNLGKRSSPMMSTASKLRRSFSPSRLANRLVSPLKSRKSVQKSDGLIGGLKQRPAATLPRRFSLGRI